MTETNSITLQGRAKNIAGLKFNKLLPIKPIARSSQGILWLCKCDCGNTTKLTTGKIISGQTRSCGCLWHGDIMHHYMSKTPTHVSWTSMRERCRNKNHINFSNYGGRGISVCGRWNDFNAFLSDMGERPPGTSIERINNNENYTPENCCWATQTEQMNNMRRNVFLTHDGITLSESQWARKVGISRQVLHYRIHKFGWSAKKALTTKPQKQKGRND